MLEEQAAFDMGALSTVPLDQVLRELDRYDAVGPIVAPTNWRNQRREREELKAVVEAAMPLWRWAKAHRVVPTT